MGCLRSLILGWVWIWWLGWGVGRERQVTLSTILQAAWAVVLSRLTGNRWCVSGDGVGSAAAFGWGGVGGGLFINTLPVAVDADGGLSLGQLLGWVAGRTRLPFLIISM